VGRGLGFEAWREIDGGGCRRARAGHRLEEERDPDAWGRGVSERRGEGAYRFGSGADWVVGRFSGRAGSVPAACYFFLFFSFSFLIPL
jgi:hypothetical protein